MIIIKHVFALFTVALFSCSIFSQIEYNSDILDANNVEARVYSCGNFFGPNNFTFDGDGFIINETNSLSPIYSHALWISGVNSSGDLHLAADGYRSNQSEDFWHGPVGDMYANDFDEAYNKVWKVERDQIENHIENFNSPGYIIPVFPQLMKLFL